MQFLFEGGKTKAYAINYCLLVSKTEEQLYPVNPVILSKKLVAALPR